MTTIHLITTGGTIEKIYSEQTGQVENLTAKIDRYLQQLRLPDARIDVMPLMNKDSLEMTEEDREIVLLAVRTQCSRRARGDYARHRHDGRYRALVKAAAG